MAAAYRIPEGAGVERGEARVGGGPLGPVGGPGNGEDDTLIFRHVTWGWSLMAKYKKHRCVFG